MNGLGSFLKSLLVVCAISLTTTAVFAENVIESIDDNTAGLINDYGALAGE